MKPHKVSPPKTNLAGHQELLAWYRSIEHLGETKPLCPLMMQVPGEWSARVVCCDIPKNQALHLQSLMSCHQDDQCLPRLLDPEPGGSVSNELVEFYRSRH